MSSLPKLAIVGRPNVGKSALFNRICKKRIAIVEETEGCTRDRIYYDSELFGLPFRVIDTGGIDPRSQATFNNEIKRQAEIAIEEADAIILVVDGQVGLTSLDEEIARILLRTKKPLTLAINKIDHSDQQNEAHTYYKLGISEMVSISAFHNYRVTELLEIALKNFSKDDIKFDPAPGIKVALVGRPNVGKSSLVNTLLDEERCIVSPIPGTTRDSIDISFTQGDDLYTLIDTAGVRRKNAEPGPIEKFASIRTDDAIERCDVCLLMLDVQEGMTTQDKKIANAIEAAGKGCIILFNKWDLVKGFKMEHILRSIEVEVPFMKHCATICISATTGRNVEKIMEEVKSVYEASKMRITTHQLNKVIEQAMQTCHPPMIDGKRLRVYYMTQVDIQPPTFILFVNYPFLMIDSYKKYLFNKFRETYPFTGIPLRIFLKGKKREKLEERLETESKKRNKQKQEPAFTKETEEEIEELDEDDFEDTGLLIDETDNTAPY